MPTLTWVRTVPDRDLDHALSELAQTLRTAGFAEATAAPELVIVWADRPLAAAQEQQLRSARQQGTALIFLGPTLSQPGMGEWLGQAGLSLGEPTAEHDVRIRPGPAASSGTITDHGHVGLGHLGEHVHSRDRVLPVTDLAEGVEVLFTANLGLAVHPIASWRPSTRTLAWNFGGTAPALRSRAFTRLFVTALRRVAGLAEVPPIRIGLLGYGAIGHEHARAATAIPGLVLAAVCDVSAERRAAAELFTPNVRTHADAEDLLVDELDLIVVSTPPQSHAEWGLRVLESGRHVIVEKPFAVTTAEADAVLAAGAQRQLLAMVYQNRRFDPDYLALRELVRAGTLGEIFHVEAFIGNYGHPCNLWHSDEHVSGGAFYDWGAHVIDQLLDLLPEPVVSVTARTHKRRWLDVTNADHCRVTMTLASGAEVEFSYSDLAAALKPRWYVLGTEGAVVGQWRTEKIIARSAVGTLAEDVLAPADSPPIMQHHHGNGSVTQLALPPGAPHPFHAELADYLRLGLPMSVTGAQSRKVLSVMEAARISAASGSQAVTPA